MVYKWYILPIGGLYATYHPLREPGNSIDFIGVYCLHDRMHCKSSVCIASTVCNIDWIILFSWFGFAMMGLYCSIGFSTIGSYFCNGWIQKKWFILFMVPISCFSHRIGFVVTIQLFNTNPRVWLPSNLLLIFRISDSSSEHCTKRLGYLVSIGI